MVYIKYNLSLVKHLQLSTFGFDKKKEGDVVNYQGSLRCVTQ